MPEFYKEVLKAWTDFNEHIKVEPKGRKQILHQPLFLNQNINMNGNTMFYKDWYKAGIKQIKDILYEVKPGFLPLQAIIDTLEEQEDIKSIKTIENLYKNLKEAIPVNWIKDINIYENGNESDKPEVFCIKGDTNVPLNSCVLRTFYSFFQNDVFEEPKANAYWKRLYPHLDVKDIWATVRMTFKSPMLENFDFLLRHNCILSEMRLCKIGEAQDAICKVCQNEDEGLLHLFFRCKKLSCFMRKMKKITEEFVCDVNVIQDKWETLFLFGFSGQAKNKYALNLWLATARHTIWNRRNIIKQKGREISVCNLYKQKLTYVIEILREYCHIMRKPDMSVKCIVNNNPFIKKTWTEYEVILPECM